MAEHDRDAGMHPTNQLLSLPAELIRACLAHLTPVDALRACCTCRELKTESASDGVWKELYRRRWPQWTLLASARPSGVTWLVTFKARYCHEVTLIVPEDHVFLMSGHCRDLYDNNTTPMLAAMCRAPRDFERIGVDHFSLRRGSVQQGHDNEPRKTTFYGSCAIERHRVGAHPLDVEWREHAKAFGHWVYCGRDRGRQVIPAATTSALPRKRGTLSSERSIHLAPTLFLPNSTRNCRERPRPRRQQEQLARRLRRKRRRKHQLVRSRTESAARVAAAAAAATAMALLPALRGAPRGVATPWQPANRVVIRCAAAH